MKRKKRCYLFQGRKELAYSKDEILRAHGLSGSPFRGCYLCGGEGEITSIKAEIFLKNEADMKEMSDMQDFEDRISQPIDGGDHDY